MNLTFAPLAQRTITLLERSNYRGGGLLIGTTIGQFIIVQALVPMALRAAALGKTMDTANTLWPQRTLGLFFCRRAPIASALLGHMVILSLSDTGVAARFADQQTGMCIVYDEEGQA